ncbi:hypothetical protein ACJ6WD_09835 [Streptomyces sp. VTCC 41912]|uniref:hypothetical protein n=1 Tax=Streptomyces sp. VTCC 41912 TaxID=3383243 RepID=UPI0038968E25
MSSRQHEQQKNLQGHYKECPDHPNYQFAPGRCRCDAITAEAERYYSEPDDMFAREWGN